MTVDQQAGVRFALNYPIVALDPDPSLLTAKAITSICQAAQRAGFDAVSFTEHPAPPQVWRDDHGHDAVDPFVALAAAAGATDDLRLITFATVLPYRNPFLTAKAVATLDRISEGRVTLGIGTGYVRGEFDALGVDFENRNELFEESVRIMREAWSGEPVTYCGLGFNAVGTVSHPTPAQSQIPLWIGGNSQAARRRVVEWADGWLPIKTEGYQVIRRGTAALTGSADIAPRITTMREQRVELGRSADFDVMYTIVDVDSQSEPAAYREQVAELSDAGVTWLSVGAKPNGVQRVVEDVERFGADIIAAFQPTAA